jgi:hypothetical protein
VQRSNQSGDGVNDFRSTGVLTVVGEIAALVAVAALPDGWRTGAGTVTMMLTSAMGRLKCGRSREVPPGELDRVAACDERSLASRGNQHLGQTRRGRSAA